jgi:hypothetical protein
MAILTIGLLGATLYTTPPKYRAVTSLLMLSPGVLDPLPPASDAPAGSTGVNPYLNFHDVSVIADVTQRIMASNPVALKMQAAGLSGSYSVISDANQAGPILDVSADATTPDQALKNTEIVVDEIKAQMNAVQSEHGAQQALFIRTSEITPPVPARVLTSAARRAMVVLVVGLALVVLSAIVADNVATGREQRRQRAAGDEVAPDDRELVGVGPR